MTTSDIGFLLNKASRQFRLGFASRLAGIGLRPQQAAALMAIGRSADGRLTPSQLASAIDTDAPTASGLLDRLVRDGWIEFTSNPDDGRSRLVSLTDKAVDVLPAVVQSAHEVSDEAMACFTTDEAHALEGLLSRLCEQGAGTPDKKSGR